MGRQNANIHTLAPGSRSASLPTPMYRNDTVKAILSADESHAGGRYYIDPARRGTLHVEIGVDRMIDGVEYQEGSISRQTDGADAEGGGNVTPDRKREGRWRTVAWHNTA